MTITDWLYLITTVVCYILAIIAGVYTKEKAKINKTTAAGKAMDVVGQLAAYAVHETEHLGLDNEQKREVAAQIITQGLSHLGVKNVTANVVNGAIEKAVNAMHLANDGAENANGEIATDVPESEVLSPVDQLKLQDTQPTEPALPVDMNAGDKNASR
ncbi:MAG: phage holin [Lactobacillus kalixensis]|uniref:phage holin n=1 Tax=Lactobacillus kalixensis TaxID=227944 RepID=UPI003991194F